MMTVRARSAPCADCGSSHRGGGYMKRKTWIASLVIFAMSTASLFAMGQTENSASKAKHILTIGREGNNSFTRNFNPFSPSSLVGVVTPVSIYEPLLIWDPANNKTIPWLATSWEWGNGGGTLTFTTRENVKWSDGKSFSAADVAYTFKLLQKSFAGGGFDYIKSVEATGPNTVVFTFKQPYSPALYEIGKQVIVPEHIWQKIADPVSYANPDPVGTGPFTQVAVFQTQLFELDKNPYYWQKGKPYIDGIRYPAYPGNDQVQLALINGDVDWADIFIPNVQATYASKSPDYHYWFTPTSYTTALIMNTTKAPFNDPIVRKAVSMSINREQGIAAEGDTGYTTPIEDATGLSNALDSWRDPAALQGSTDWTKYNVELANSMLDQAGYPRGSDGIRVDHSGKKISGDIIVGCASTDWTADSEVIAQNLKSIGFDINVHCEDWGLVVDQLQKGNFTMAHTWTGAGSTPYDFYRWTMSTEEAKPIGTVTNENYGRYGNKEATDLLRQFAATFDSTAQHQIVNKLEKIFVDNAPVAPLFSNPDWGEYSTARFTGFPNKDNPYALLETRLPTAVLVLTNVKPK